jgi:hypothetical protein
MNAKNPRLVAGALGFSLLVPLLGLVFLGPLYAVLFLVGYLGGFVFWLGTRARATWKSIRTAYSLNLLAFLLLHKVEENRTDFFRVVSEKITHTPPPEVSLGLIIALLVVPLAAWIATPFVIRRHGDLGRYLAWTLFASMGLTELAHFIMPLLANEPYGYFPGMASVLVLAPLGWWGMWKLGRSRSA